MGLSTTTIRKQIERHKANACICCIPPGPVVHSTLILYIHLHNYNITHCVGGWRDIG